jgi:hypothetical protein
VHFAKGPVLVATQDGRSKCMFVEKACTNPARDCVDFVRLAHHQQDVPPTLYRMEASLHLYKMFRPALGLNGKRALTNWGETPMKTNFRSSSQSVITCTS